MRPHDLTRDAQAEALPAAAEPAARARGFHAEEPIEDAPAIRLGYFRAGICNPEDGHAVVRGEPTADRAGLSVVFDRVVEKIHHELAEELRAAFHSHTACEAELDADLQPVAENLDVLCKFLDQPAQRNDLGADGEFPRVRLREKQQALDDVNEPASLIEHVQHRALDAVRELAGAQRDLEFAADDRERRLEFVRGVRAEAPRLLETALEPVNHPVQHVGEVPDLILAAGDGEPLIEPLGGDVLRGIHDVVHRLQRHAVEPARAANEEGERQREDERVGPPHAPFPLRERRDVHRHAHPEAALRALQDSRGVLRADRGGECDALGPRGQRVVAERTRAVHIFSQRLLDLEAVKAHDLCEEPRHVGRVAPVHRAPEFFGALKEALRLAVQR